MPGSRLESGTQIGHFRIESEIGRGGMGVVYLARDAMLGRAVAIKSLPPELTADVKTWSRLRREARVLASLNHPNVAAIYDELEEAQGVGYLVLEYVPGQTLADRLARGPMPLQDALSAFAQVADGLEAAHRAGIVHRDLKPANIKITDQGRVKILDFGIAKAVAKGGAELQTTVTQPGHVIGTPQYMSPEQARGKPTDRRADIWGFGCCLYEALTGRPAFSGETESDTVSQILQGQVDWDTLPVGTPHNVRVLLRRCLEKDLNKRLRDIGDAGIEITETLNRGAVLADSHPVRAYKSVIRSPLTAAGLCLVCLVLGAVVGALTTRGFPDKSNPRLLSMRRVSSEPLPDGVSLLMSEGGSIAISRDGRYRAYIGIDVEGVRRFYVRDTTVDYQARPIRGTEGACGPFFRPDGEWIGFFAEDESTAEFALKRVRVRGGTPEFVCRVPPEPCGGSWSQDDHIVFSPIYHQSLVSVAAFGDGGVLEYPARLDPNSNEHGQSWPDVLPDGKGILYTVWGGRSVKDYRTMIKWADIDKPQELLADSSFARFVPATGHIVFLREGSLQAVPFDVDHPGAGPIRETPEVLIENLGATLYGAAQFAFARDEGTVLWASGSAPLGLVEGELVWVDRERPEGTPIPQSRGYYSEWSAPRLSPDEELIAIATADETNLLLYKFGTGYSRPVTVMTGYQGGAVWRPGPGDHLAFYSLGADSPPDVYWKPWNSSDEPELLLKTANSEQATSFSPNGENLAVTVHHVSEKGLAQTSDIWIISPQTGSRIEWTRTAHCSEWGAAFSPDGRWIAYTSDELGQKNVYVRRFPEGPTEKVGPGSEVMWRPDSQKAEVFYRHDGQMWRAELQTEPDLKIIGTESLFKDVHLATKFPEHRNYDYSETRKQFLMIRQVDEQPTLVTQLRVEHNRFEQLKRIAPGGQD
jgi:serine/threonine-protein kinase